MNLVAQLGRLLAKNRNFTNNAVFPIVGGIACLQQLHICFAGSQRAAEVGKNNMRREIEAAMEERGRRKVATGTWLYDQTTPMELTVWAKPAHLASSRFDEDDHFIETSPIPETRDGFLYFYWPGGFREYMTIEEAKAAADAEPWGPIKWD